MQPMDEQTPANPPAEEQGPLTPPTPPRRSWARWIVPAFALAVTVVAGLLLWGNLRSDTWSYFTDEQGMRVDVDEDRHRFVLWDDPRQSTFDKGTPEDPEIPGFERLGHGRAQAAFSPDGTKMVFAYRCQYEGDKQPHTDLFVSEWDGRTWSRPQPLIGVNSTHNERSAAFSPDGKSLYFSSDRPGGLGGQDIYVASASASGWSDIRPLSDAVNSAQDETGAAPAADGSGLYFTSKRTVGATDQDLYFAKRIAAQSQTADQDAAEQAPGEQTSAKPSSAEPSPADEAAASAPPMYEPAVAIDELNSTANDAEAAASERGGYLFIASDRDRDDSLGTQVYLSRIVDGQATVPQRVDVYIDRGSVADPTVRMDGFDLLFSADAGMATGAPAQTQQPGNEASGMGLFRSTTREVIGYFDLSRWEAFKTLLNRVAWWLLLAIAALVGLIYLLEKWQDITSLFHKCLAGSIMAHLLLLLLMMFWMISQELATGGEPQSPEVALSIDALAEEELAMESEQELAQVAQTTRMVVAKQVNDFSETRFEATDVVTDPVAIVRQTNPESLVSLPTPSAASESDTFEPLPLQDAALPAADALAPTLLPDLEVAELEVQEVSDTPPVDLTDGDFKLDPTALQKVETDQAEVAQVQPSSINVQSDAGAVTANTQAPAATDTGGQTINPSAGFESNQPLPDLTGDDGPAGLAANLPGADPLDALTQGPKLETPDHELDPAALTKLIRKQTGKPSLDVIEELGGSEGTERAIASGLEWLTRNQEPDGHWDMSKHGSTSNYNTAGAGLALLCYYGWGIKHGKYGEDSDYPQHNQAVTKALNWLIAQQKEDGDLRGSKSQHAMYCHGIAAIALCEAYALTEAPELKEPARLATQFILDAQHEKGGWRYRPGEAGDLSVTGWQLMALHSANMAGIEVPQEAFDKARRFLDSVAGGKQGGRYGYTRPTDGDVAMTPTGMFLRQLDLQPPDQPRMIESAQYMRSQMLKPGKRRFYYEYYATLALYQHQGPIWQQWNENMKDIYIASQTATGEHEGSWDPDLDRKFAKRGGRVTTTALAILSLEVYYRLLPLYGYDRETESP